MATASGFESATRVRDLGDGRYAGEIHEGWDIGGNANGGYLLAMVGRALCEATGRPDPVTITGHFLSPGKPGPVAISTSIVRAGRRFTTATATMAADEQPLLTVLGISGDVSPVESMEWSDRQPPELPDPKVCVPMQTGDALAPPFRDKVELRFHPDDAGFLRGEGGTGRAELRGWFRLPHGEPVDTFGLLCAVDAFPPTIFNADLPMGWTPTVELTVHVRARPAPGWLACRFGTHFVSNGFLEEEAEAWDATGRLVAQSRQLALVPRA
jgi:hypothetical protein